MVLRGVKDRTAKFNVSVAEVEHHDLWQRAALAVVTVATDGARGPRVAGCGERDRTPRARPHQPHRNRIPDLSAHRAAQGTFSRAPRPGPQRVPGPMPLSHRVERIAEQIREEMSQILATEISDPGVGLVTVTPRQGHARPLAGPRLLDDHRQPGRSQADHQGAAPRRALRAPPAGRAHDAAPRPRGHLQFDEGVAAQDRVEQLIQQIHQEDAERQAAAPPADGSDAPDAVEVAEIADAPDAAVPPDAGPGDDEAPEPKA